MGKLKLDLSDDLNKSLEERGFPKNFTDNLAKYEPFIKEIMDNVAVNRDFQSHLQVVRSLENELERIRDEIQTLQSVKGEKNTRELQSRTREWVLKYDLNLEKRDWEIQDRHYDELCRLYQQANKQSKTA